MKRHLSMSILLIATLVAIGLFSSSALAAQAKPQVGFQAPDATLKNLQGQDVVISDIIEKNKVTIIVFWATWCPTCNAEVPELRKLYQKYSGQGLEIIAISFNEKPDVVKSWVERNVPGYPVYQDKYLGAHGKYAVYTIPVVFVVDQTGIIRNIISGSGTFAAFEKSILPLLEAE